MNNRVSTFSWIRGLPEYTTSCLAWLNKRKLIHQEPQLASPPAFLETGNKLISTPKRRPLEGSAGGSGPDVTVSPRAFAGHIQSFPFRYKLYYLRKLGKIMELLKQALLRLAGEMEIKALDIYRYGFDNLLEFVEKIGRNHNILPYHMKSTVEEKVMNRGRLATLLRFNVPISRQGR
ncbi:hypothetical protein F4860DRAFT_510271 [Xylaria cubensis]|nr:hypothetical protein F4860DRAFT_510271 [Xylaria cubensis]